MNTIIQSIQEKAILLKSLSEDSVKLFAYINSEKTNAQEVLGHNAPDTTFRPVKMLRFLIAKKIKDGSLINEELVVAIKSAIEDRDVSKYYALNKDVLESLRNYKQSKSGMFPNWKQPYKVLFPFINSAANSKAIKKELSLLADKVIEVNQLKNVKKNIVGFEGPQNYGTDHVWVAIVPENAPNVQKAYQIFFTITSTGLRGGIYQGHQISNNNYSNDEKSYQEWKYYLEEISQKTPEWQKLNKELNFSFQNEEIEFKKRITKTDIQALKNYFELLDRLVEELDLQDTENLVFSTANNRLSFQVGKRICLNVRKNKFDFIAPETYILQEVQKEEFTAPNNAFLYLNVGSKTILSHYEALRDAAEYEIERDNHTEAKSYDNSAFRKAVYDEEYRKHILDVSGKKSSYYLVGAYWSDDTPQDQTERFVNNNIWMNGYDDQFFSLVNKVKVGDHIAIRALDKRNDNMYIKARGVVTKNLSDGQNLLVEWESGLNSFKLDFTGGYWQTIRKVTKEKHINAIWQNYKIMQNVKEEFVNWLIANPRSKYFNNEKSKISDYLEDALIHFPKNIFECSSNTFHSIITLIDSTINNNKETFLKAYGANDSGKLAAILGNQNYQQFLREKFSAQKGQDNPDDKTHYNAPLNQIFYGPPGTGKTYKTILEAAKIVEQDENINYTNALKVFNSKLGDQIEFITFHQNYSYEDFIQGLRPDTEVSGELSFFKSDGVFKKIADNALKNYKEANTVVQKKRPFLEVFEEFIEPLIEGEKEEIEVAMKRVSFFITNINDKSIDFRKRSGGTGHTLSIATLSKMYQEENTQNIQGLSSYYDPLLKQLLKIGKIAKKEKVTKKNYVIIIDEINRANISRVFGELITLIEKDKRFGGKIPITATLPSGEKFVVPSNLYIIGTMNTADKSIALLDIALRRRFEFVAMYPNSESIGDKIVHDPEILDQINKEVIIRKGHDFTIGHAYFMGEEYELENTINNKVIPLLLEYFMNDTDEVKKILNVANLSVDGWPMKLVSNG